MNIAARNASQRAHTVTENGAAGITTKSRLLVIYLFVYILSPRTNLDLENYYGD